MNTVINRCASGEFRAIETLAEGVYRFGWGAQAEMLPVIEDDEPTGEFVESGMVTYEATIFYGQPTAERIEVMLSDTMRVPTLEEVDAMLVGIDATEEQRVATLKTFKKAEVERHDKSSAVNQFYIGETVLWLDKETRTGLKLRFEAEIATGKTDTTLWNEGVQYPLPLETAIQMLYALEVYASASYDQTQAHLAAIDALTTVEEVESYDHTAGYPEKLRF